MRGPEPVVGCFLGVGLIGVGVEVSGWPVVGLVVGLGAGLRRGSC